MTKQNRTVRRLSAAALAAGAVAIATLSVQPGVAAAQPPGVTQHEPDASTAQDKRFYDLPGLAKDSFNAGRTEDARNFARELLALAPKYQGDWNYGNAIHDANMVLGRVAVQEGRFEDAERSLFEAGKTPGSPQLDTFGPNMSLAKDLLEKDRRQVVLDYFESCRKFWELHDGRLDTWRQQVSEGQIPDFGANLLY
ncbi:hypothetical protein NDR87_36485 [Nocardia sp. CDC159]|uniref:Tetratricopeptide repeat protein n=1 Tax=Nocardia pulmonis TaxID=2951408 RepID=A0A9X2EER5_9NOCA|nr:MULTISPECIES: hypothetical protein [Nocardia]MCM6778985.1 hypothetical protein [Nocardia pulmonis]MCM6791876.1 hypothetical protein [Nocardia sp. CDC159]